MSRIEFVFGSRAKPSGIDPEIRAQIDAAVAEGRITRVPRGASGLPAMRWNGEKLVYVHTSGDGNVMREITRIEWKKLIQRAALRRARAAKRSGAGEGAS